MEKRKRSKVTFIRIVYHCPELDRPLELNWDGKIPQNAGASVESSSCEHCGHEEAFDLWHRCECGKTHRLTLYSYRNG